MSTDNEINNSSIDIETKEIMKDFVSEAYHLLDKAVSTVTELDSNDNSEAVNIIFRLFHSIKGSAGFLNLTNIRELTHEAETLLDMFRNQEIIPTKEEINILYESFNILEELIHKVSKTYSDKGSENKVKDIVKSIDNIISKKKIIEKKIYNNTEELFTEDNLDIEKYGYMGTFAENIDKKNLSADIINEYIKQTNKIIHNCFGLFDELKNIKNNKDLVIDLLKYNYSLKRNSEAIGYEEIEKFTEEIEKLLLKIISSETTVNKDIITVLKNSYYMIKQSINTINYEEEKNKPENIVNKKEIIDLIHQIIGIKKSGTFRQLGEILMDMGVVDPETLEEALYLQKETSKGKKLEYEESKSSLFQYRKEDIIRVDTKRLDELFDLIGELTIAEIMVTHNPDIQNMRLENFTKAASNLTKITNDLQSIILSIRMVPLDSLFNKMLRLVNQLTRDSDKNISFNISGASTEVDRKLIEKIYDPLVHIIRNSVDHGIENKDERKQKNKPEKGKIKLSAKHEGNEIWISVSDDGKGLDRNAIINKAIKMNLDKGKNLDVLPDEEIWKIIFEPGFSTAEKVSDISGRGVGMDVVRKNIEKLRGQIDIYSVKDNGTEITLKIPLTLEIMNVMVMRVGNNLYSIPISDIVETLSINKKMVFSSNENKYSMKIRDEIIPMLKLNELLRIKSDNNEIYDGISVIIKKHNKNLCITIDEIIGTQQVVIKSMPNYFGRLNIISGCSILGDGDISLIIDTGSLINAYIS